MMQQRVPPWKIPKFFKSNSFQSLVKPVTKPLLFDVKPIKAINDVANGVQWIISARYELKQAKSTQNPGKSSRFLEHSGASSFHKHIASTLSI